jgi:hypothetical protein
MTDFIWKREHLWWRSLCTNELYPDADNRAESCSICVNPVQEDNSSSASSSSSTSASNSLSAGIGP